MLKAQAAGEHHPETTICQSQSRSMVRLGHYPPGSHLAVTPARSPFADIRAVSAPSPDSPQRRSPAGTAQKKSQSIKSSASFANAAWAPRARGWPQRPEQRRKTTFICSECRQLRKKSARLQDALRRGGQGNCSKCGPQAAGPLNRWRLNGRNLLTTDGLRPTKA